MRQDESGAGSDLVGARALREWITGVPERYARVFLVESGALADRVARAAGRDDVILLPEESGPCAGPAHVARYAGALHDIGDELFFGERCVELQDYVAAAFLQFTGPTALGLFEGASWQALLDDAELARRTGVFPSALIDPRVLLADRGALSEPGELATPSAVRVRADGTVSIGVQGDTLGIVDELPAILSALHPRAVALDESVRRDLLVADRSIREGVLRYLGATDLMKMLRLANGDTRISGFGWALVDDGFADAAPSAADPFLIETTDGFVLADTRTLRRQLLSPATAQVVAVTQTSSTPEVAAERAARQLGASVVDARALCLEAVTALRIRFGIRDDVARPANGIRR
ncbi:daptide biosynthesis RiPP recognition protein [Microbacterium paraoxydans]|uniref:daptide biosynthesis RiPP recognition protein n=1 Tax=Microbacterium paraoxydans TaxID=199592 RepID=UPI001CF9ACC5|nr:daptide biosynthesis RiPP recognition protein [Microbacterium paraoxydans]